MVEVTRKDIVLLILSEINLMFVAEVKSIEYDPNRSAFIALIEYLDGEKNDTLCSKWT